MAPDLFLAAEKKLNWNGLNWRRDDEKTVRQNFSAPPLTRRRGKLACPSPAEHRRRRGQQEQDNLVSCSALVVTAWN